MKKEYYLTDESADAIVNLINQEIRRNIAKGDDAYNGYWENLIQELGFAVIR